MDDLFSLSFFSLFLVFIVKFLDHDAKNSSSGIIVIFIAAGG